MHKDDLMILGVVAVVGGVIGALAGLGLSSTAWPALIIGGIVAAVSTIFVIFAMCLIAGGLPAKEHIFPLFSMCVASAAIGVGLVAVTGAIFPGVMLAGWSAALAGGLIGVIAPIAGFLVGTFATEHVIISIVDKVSEWITSPKAESARESEGAAPAP